MENTIDSISFIVLMVAMFIGFIKTGDWLDNWNDTNNE